VLEAPYGGFLSTYSGEEELSYLTDGLGQRWEILSVGFKLYATAASVQSVLFAIDHLMAENALVAADIDEVAIYCSTMAYRHCAWPYEPQGVTAAQMNLYFTSAMMILDRNAMQEQFREDRLADPAALEIIEKIAIFIDTEYDVGGDATRHCAHVEIITSDGRRVAREVLERPGSPGNPLSPQQLCRKFETLAGAILPPERIARIIETVQALEDSDARTLIGLATLGDTP